MAKRYWLMKSEPDEVSIDQLRRSGPDVWTGVRNYQARNFMRQMQPGDEVLFYHSNADPSGVAGVARVTRTGIVDPTQFDRRSEYYDPKSTKAQPRWDCVEIAHVDTFRTLVTLDRLRAEPDLADMAVLQRGTRLSVQPVTASEFKKVVAMGHSAGTNGTARPTATAGTRVTR